MPAFVSRLVSLLVLATAMVTVTGCGGGGGGDGGGGGGGSSNGLTVSTTSIRISVNRYDSLPPAELFTVRWTNPNVAGILVGVPAGQTVPSWLSLSSIGTSSPVTISAGVNTTNLDAGTYSVTLRIVSGDSNANPIDIVDIPLTYVVSEPFISPTTDLTFEHVLGTVQPPAEQVFRVNGQSVNYTATADQPWVSLSSPTGITPSNVGVGIDPTGLAVGDHTAVVTVTNDSNASESFTVDVALQVRLPAVHINRVSMSFDGVNGTTIDSKLVGFTLENSLNSAWTLSASEPWIVLDSTSWPGPDFVSVSVDPGIGPLASGVHTGEITFTTDYLGNTLSQTIPVTLTLTPATLTILTTNLDYQGGPAEDFLPQDIQFRLDTSLNEFPWQLNLVEDNGSGWLQAPVASGTVSAIIETTSIEVDRAGQTDDSFTGTVEMVVTINGDTLTGSVPVEMLLEPHRLFVADNGVALMDSPGLSKLTQTVTVSDNRDIVTPWTATSDQAWLSTTASGQTDGDLVLTADPTGLAVETIHYATVTISSAAPTVTNSGDEVIKVGLYLTGTTPTDQVTAAVPRIVSDGSGLVADPIRPYVYVTHGGPDIEVYNIYTGALEDTLSNAGTDLRSLAISSDGDLLYALDYAGIGIVSVDLTSSPASVNAPWNDPDFALGCDCTNTFYFGALQYTRLAGREVLIGGHTHIVDANTGDVLFKLFQSSFFTWETASAITANGSILFSGTSNTSAIWRHQLKYSEIDDAFSITETHRSNRQGGPRGLSTDPNGDIVYRACWYPDNEFEWFNGADLSILNLLSSGTNGGTIYGPDDLVYCARYYSDFSAPGSGDIWSVDPLTGTIVAEFLVPGEVDTRRFRISGDGQRLIVRSNDQAMLSLIAIP